MPSVESTTSTTRAGAGRTTQAPGSGSASSTTGAGASTTSGTFAAPAKSSTTTAAPSSEPGGRGAGPTLPADSSDGRQQVSVSFPGSNPLAVLLAIRTGAHDTFERVVFEFRDGDAIPGVQVGYAEQAITMDASGEPVSVPGDRVLVVRMQAASRADSMQNPPPMLYSGPDRVPGTRSPVTEVVFMGDFEARLSWAIGVVGNPRFTLATMVNPTRVVLDVSPSAT